MSSKNESPYFQKDGMTGGAPALGSPLVPGIPDEDFIRDKVPMTKEEVRVVAISKLRLDKNSLVYDIGSGTGSVALEIARLSPSIEVYAVEVKDEAISLIRQNCKRFGCGKVHVVKTLAPEGLEELPAPTHAFIGGSKGRLGEILAFLKSKNPRVRIVATAVSLETVAEMQTLLKSLDVTDLDIVQLAVSRSEKIGEYHMMKANNPVYIYSFSFTGEH